MPGGRRGKGAMMATSPLDESVQLSALLVIKEAVAATRRMNEQIEELVLRLFPDEPPPLRLVGGGDDA